MVRQPGHIRGNEVVYCDIRERQTAEPRQEERQRNARPLDRAALPVLVRVYERVDDGADGRLSDPGRERHGEEARRPREHRKVEHVQRAEPAEQRGHAHLQEDRHGAHAGERAADLRGLHSGARECPIASGALMLRTGERRNVRRARARLARGACTP